MDKPTPESYNNKYYVMRHGESLPNKSGLIVSNLIDGMKPEHGLTEHGKEQARLSVEEFKRNTELGARALVVCSPFSRTEQTAEEAEAILEPEHMLVSLSLRERFFGKWDMTTHENYPQAWQNDTESVESKLWRPNHDSDGVELPAAVAARAFRLVSTLDDTYSGYDILLVSHGDPLNIMRSVADGYQPHEHRQIEGIKTAEIHRLA